MKMYNKFRQYQEKPKNRQPPRTSRTIEFVRGMLFYATPLGCLWWFAELKYAGAAFFFCLAILICGTVTLPFINLYGSIVKEDEEQVVKDEVGIVKLSGGCLAAVLGPVLGIWLFALLGLKRT